jgi:hypothetical protein
MGTSVQKNQQRCHYCDQQNWDTGVPPYLCIHGITLLAPWTVDAIEKKIARGVLKLGIHYFQPSGHRTERIFKWSEIIKLIESPFIKGGSDVVQRQRSNSKRQPIDVEKTKTKLQRLLD